jgi:hypothetical protein
MKTICFDYDGSYTEFPTLFIKMMAEAKKQGHDVIMATMRHRSEKDCILESIEKMYPVFYTGRVGKLKFLSQRGIIVDLWIDDQPHFIVQDAFS